MDASLAGVLPAGGDTERHISIPRAPSKEHPSIEDHFDVIEIPLEEKNVI